MEKKDKIMNMMKGNIAVKAKDSNPNSNKKLKEESGTDND